MAGRSIGSGRVIGVLFALVLAGGIGFGVIALRELHRRSTAFWSVVQKHSDDLVEASSLHLATDQSALFARIFLLSGDAEMLRMANLADAEFDGYVQDLRARTDDPESERLLTQIQGVKQQLRALGRHLHPGATSADRAQIIAESETKAQQLQRQIGHLHGELDARQRELFAQAKTEAIAAEHRGRQRLGAIALAGVAVALTAALFLLRAWELLRKSREELEDVNAQLVQSNHDLDAFGGRIAHDLRNLLGPVALAASTLNRAAEQPEIVHSIAERLGNIVRRSNRLIEELLTFSRAGQPADTAARASVPEAVRDAVEDLEPNARAMSAHVEVDVPDTTVACAPSLLHTLLVNLVGNAIKFLDGRTTREVRISARTLDGVCEIAIADTGPGIPEDARRRLFTPFYRVPGTRAAGTGIGLATVSRIVNAHRGTITVESTPERGSVFRVRLPLPA